MQAFYWSEEEYQDDMIYEAAVRELERHTWTAYTRNGPTVLHTGGATVEIVNAGESPYYVERAMAAARLRAWRRGGLTITRGQE